MYVTLRSTKKFNVEWTDESVNKAIKWKTKCWMNGKSINMTIKWKVKWWMNGRIKWKMKICGDYEILKFFFMKCFWTLFSFAV